VRILVISRDRGDGDLGIEGFRNSELLQMVGVKGITPNPELCGF